MRNAVVFEPHEYVAGKGKCGCPDGDHVPCKVCGSGADAYVHTDEAAAGAYTLVRVESADAGSGAERA